VASFISTNIDDILVLMLFFSGVNNAKKRYHIVIGQYIGIGALTIISVIGALGVSIVPQKYVGLLGLVPIYLGIKAYVDYKKENIQDENFVNATSIATVCGVTIANGGDNIGIYIPLFGSMRLVDIFVTVIVFAILTALWCFIALKLAEHPFIQENIDKYKHIFVPIVFIGLGIFILMESGTLSLIFKI
jgi:cadmium resistance transport/sequestration family protein